jgi:beta-lactam-binding protein with PASTA domain
MRTCQSCGRENPDDRDFCECGEYLRWEPTGHMQAVTPEVLKQAAEPAAPTDGASEPAEPAAPAPPATPAPEPSPPAAAAPPQAAPPPPPAQPPSTAPQQPARGGGEAGAGDEARSAEAGPKTAVQGAVRTPQHVSVEQAAAEGAAITLRLPDRDAVQGETVALAVEPGQRERVLALVRNQSGIVDNYELRVEGLPEGWWSVFPDTVYLVPFGAGGTYEQEVEIHLHPPRSPEAEAKPWDLRVVAHSKAHGRDATGAPLQLVIRPYTETATTVRPQRAKGRRKADFDVAVENKANAAVLVALEGTDPDGELEFGFNRPPTQIPAGDTVMTTMRVRPPKQIWIGRPVDKRLEVGTLTGEAAEERLAAEPVPAEVLQQADGAAPKRGLFGRRRAGVPGFYGPKVYKPQVLEPGVQIGPGGINIRKPNVRAPRVQAPKMKAVNLKPSSLKLPGGGGGASAPAAPLLPSQAVFRQKAWLPWWLVPVAMLLALLAVLLYLLLPKNVVVPDVVGSATAFEAEQKLTDADLRLAPTQKEEVSQDAEPGTVIGQTPAAGESVEKNSEVSLLVAIGNGDVTVPKIVGLTPQEADTALREETLSLGQATPAEVDPEAKIASQIPAEGEIVKEGTPVNIFFAEAEAGAGEDGEGGAAGAGGAGGGGGGGGAGGGGGGGGGATGEDVVVPEIDGAGTEEYAKKVAEEGLLPTKVTAFDASKAGTLFKVDPKPGTTVNAGSEVTLLVSSGAPQLVFDNDEDILRVDSGTRKKLDPIADGPSREKDPTFSADGSRVAYQVAGQVFLRNLDRPDASPVQLTGPGEEYGDLAWAPTTDRNLLAMARVDGNDRNLCFGEITRQGMQPKCLDEAQHSIGVAIHWAPDGKSILATGVNEEGRVGIVRWTSDKAFSPDIGDWERGKFETDITNPDQSVLDAAISPDGKRLAAVVKEGDRPYRLVLAKADDFTLGNAEPTGVRACKVIWRPDGRELVVVQADAACAEGVGELVRLPADNPTRQTQLNAAGDNPVFQPPQPEG